MADTLAAARRREVRREASRQVLRALGRSLLTFGLTLVVVLVLWTGAIELFGISSYVAKGPTDVWAYLVTDDDAGEHVARLRDDLGVSLVHAFTGFVAGLVVALLGATAFRLSRGVEHALMPIAMLLRSVPLVAMAPVLLLIFGQGRLGVATIGAIVVLFPALVNIVLGLRSASPLALDLVKVNGGGELKALLLVRVPSALPAFFASVRISVPGAIVGAMLAEWLSGFTGLGGILNAYKGRGNFSGVWAIVVVSVVTSIVGYAVAAVVEAAALAAWGPDAGKSARR